MIFQRPKTTGELLGIMTVLLTDYGSGKGTSKDAAQALIWCLEYIEDSQPDTDDMGDAATIIVANWLRAWFNQHEKLTEDAMNQLRITMRAWAKEWFDESQTSRDIQNVDNQRS